MKYQNVANQLAAEGRGPDSMLVHMAPSEVRGLQALAMAHGGSLTTNPTTGLPEAGFLSNILPMVAGAALMATGIGAPAAAMLVGGGTALATGDINKGLMAGLGAYGGAGLGAGLMSAGTAAAQSALPAFGDPNIAGEMVAQTAQNAAASPFSTMGQGLSSVASSGAGGEAARQGFMSGVGGLGGLAKYGLAAASPMLMGGEANRPGMSQTQPLNRYGYAAQPTTPTPTPDVPGYGDMGRNFGREQRYFDGRYVDTGRKFVPGEFATTTPMPMADGGTVGSNQTYPLSHIPSTQTQPNIQDPQQVNVLRNTPVPEVDPFTGEARFASGGISHLGGYSDGGRMLRGPGDGVSDSIPATIGDRQPARLADGEFVIPARIVSELGNGSSEAGARRLYAMMDRVQKARQKTVGKGKVAVDSKAEKHLPV